MQRKMLFLIPLTILLCFALAAASAETRQEFEQGCWVKTSGSTTLYRLEESSAGSITTGTDLSALFLPAGTLSAGTYVRISRTLDDYSMDYVTFWQGGGRSTGYIHSSALTSAVTTVRTEDGVSFDVPEALARDTAALLKYINANSKGKTYVYDAVTGTIRLEQKKPDDPNNSTPADKTVSQGADVIPAELEPCSFYHQGEEVELLALGFAYASIRKDGQALTVPTQELTWESAAKASQQLARIYAPKSGEATMRDQSNKKGAVIEMLPSGTVVAVIRVGGSYARVCHNGTVGFVMLDALKFAPNQLPDVQSGVLTSDGRTGEIVVHDVGKTGSNMIGAYPAGTPVVIFSIGKTWAEIEVDGLHGFVLSSCVSEGSNEPAVTITAVTKPASVPDEDEINTPDAPVATIETEYVKTPAPVIPAIVPIQLAPSGSETEDAYPFDTIIDGDAIG